MKKKPLTSTIFLALCPSLLKKKSCGVKYRVQTNMPLIFFIPHAKTTIIFRFIISISHVKIADLTFVKNIEILIIF